MSLQTREVPIEGNVPREQYDWFIGMNKFFYYPSASIVINDETGDAMLVYQVIVHDYYAWYENKGINPFTGEVNERFETGILMQ